MRPWTPDVRAFGVVVRIPQVSAAVFSPRSPRQRTDVKRIIGFHPTRLPQPNFLNGTPHSALQCHFHHTDLSLRQLGLVSAARRKTSFLGFDVSGFLAVCRQHWPSRWSGAFRLSTRKED